MNKNAYEIRLDILSIAHQYESQLFLERAKHLKENNSEEELKKLYPSRDTVLKTAELFYTFVSDGGKNSR
jgi:hypothetical protein